METLSDFVASAIEFIVGGVVFSGAVVLLLSTGADLPPVSDTTLTLLTSYAPLITVLFIAGAYAMGVIAESAARFAFEFLLERKTVRTVGFGATSAPLGGAGRPEPRTGMARFWEVLRFGRQYTIEQGRQAIAEREEQRVRVMTDPATLNGEVQSQLKRLRLERVVALSLFVATVALARGGYRGWFVIALIATAVMVLLVRDRSGRYCRSISRANNFLGHEILGSPEATGPLPTGRPPSSEVEQ